MPVLNFNFCNAVKLQSISGSITLKSFYDDLFQIYL
jgi:hypothetical protein